jgi:chromate reductase
MKKTLGIFVGSLRKASFTRVVATYLAGVLEERFTIKEVDIGNLALFNQDFDDENRTPAEWTEFRNTVKGLDAVLFLTPEYNRAVPPVLKNAVDIGSRPYGQNVWAGKPGVIVGVSPGKIGGAL